MAYRSILLAAPWGLAHFRTWPARYWSVSIALAAASLPPLGLMDGPLPNKCRVVFPGTGWFCIIAVLFLRPSSSIARGRAGDRRRFDGVGACDALWGPRGPADVGGGRRPFGRSESDCRTDQSSRTPSGSNKGARLWRPRSRLSSDRHPRWTKRPRRSGIPLFRLWRPRQIALLGATVAIPASPERLNGVIIRGASEPALFLQHVPPPFSMWKPWTDAGFPLDWAAPIRCISPISAPEF